MRIALISASLILCVCMVAGAQAQEGAPLPLLVANADLPANYVPLPPGMETEPLENFLEEAPAPVPVAPAPVAAPVAEEAPLVLDPVAHCRGLAGYDSDRALGQCLEQSYGESLRLLEQAAKTAHAAAVRRGQDVVRLLASTNMAFVAFRDAECTRQKNNAADAQAAIRAEWACHAGLNNMRVKMLAQP